jgi:hypothetical protein
MNPLADNVSDLRPRNHLYVSSGSGTVAVNCLFDTTRLSDGWHQFTAVGYEGTSVATQTRVTENVQIQNTSLAATLTAVPAGSNATPGQQLQFTVTAMATNISRIELFSTGGSLGVVSNAATAVFPISASYLGLGLHPFYAVITDADWKPVSNGHGVVPHHPGDQPHRVRHAAGPDLVGPPHPPVLFGVRDQFIDRFSNARHHHRDQFADAMARLGG